MKTLKDFTPEIQAKIPEYIKKYTEGVFDGGRYNSFKKENAEELIHWNYEKCGYKKPIVLVAENIYELQIFWNYIITNKKTFLPIIYINYCLKNNIELPKEISEALRNQLHNQLRNQLDNQLRNQLDNQLDNQLYNQLHNQLRNQLRNQLHNQLDNQLHNQLDNQLHNQLDNQLHNQLDNQLHNQLDNQLDNQLRNQLRNQLDNQLHNQLDNQLRNQLDNQLDNQLYNQLRNQLHNQLRNQLDNQLRKYNDMYLWTTNIYSNVSASWYKFIKDEFNMPIDKQIGIDLDSWDGMYLKSGIYSAIFSELVCIVSKYPKKIHRNGDRLHNQSGVAVEWGNSTDLTKMDCYYINGRNIPSGKFLQASENRVTKSDWLQEKNEDIKAAWFEILGSERVMNILEAKEIDTTTIVHESGEMEELSLYKTPFILEEIGEPLAWVKFICPSTGSNYLISVNPKHKKVMAAVLDSCPFYGKEINSVEEYNFNSRG